MASANSTRVEQLPYLVLQHIGTYLNVDDRYTFAESCLQICDAMDTDLVWFFPDEQDERHHNEESDENGEIEAEENNNNNNNDNDDDDDDDDLEANNMIRNNSRSNSSRIMKMRRIPTATSHSTTSAPTTRDSSWEVGNLFDESNFPQFSRLANNNNKVKSRIRNQPKFLRISQVFPNTIENPLPVDISIPLKDRQEQENLIFSILKQRNTLPESFRFRCNSFKRFQFLVVTRILPRTCSLLLHEKHYADTICDWTVFGRSDSIRFHRYRDEVQDCANHRAITFYVEQNKLPRHIATWLHAVSAHAQEVALLIEHAGEMKAPAQLTGILHVSSLFIYSYMLAMRGYISGMSWFLNRFAWTRNKFSDYIISLANSQKACLNFFAFPRYANAQMETVRGVLSGDSGAGGVGENILARLQRAGLDRGLLLLDHNALVKNPSICDKGIPAVPLDALALGAVLFGSASAFMGGRTPSLHLLAPRFAGKMGLQWKLIFDVFRTTIQFPIDAGIYFLFTRAFETMIPQIQEMASKTTTAATSNRLVNLVATFGSLVYSKLTPVRVQTAFAIVEHAGETIVKTGFLNPVVKYIVAPVAKAAHLFYEAEFGCLNSAAAASLLASGGVSVAIGLITEMERPSFKFTVTRQHFRSFHVALTHATFHAVLAILRWRMYAAGYGFWKSSAVELSIRVGVTVIELFFARYNRYWRKPGNKKELEKQRAMKNLAYDHGLDYRESDDDF